MKIRRIIFYIFLVIFTIICETYLFLNRNAWLGLGLVLVTSIVCGIYRHKTKRGGRAFLGLVIISVLATFISLPKEKLVPATYEGAKETSQIKVAEGKLTGVYNRDESVEVYAGIPYAKAPVGDLRWKEPQDPDKYEGLLKADHFKPMAMQKRQNSLISTASDVLFYHNVTRTIKNRYLPKMSEDCLYLNVWKPAGDKKNLPVVFYIHGGSLTTGQSWWQDYNGESYAKKDVIFFFFFYRLGDLGFYADENLARESANNTTGMYGFLDQVKALEWVNKNIKSFGGDPNKITIAGESAGSSSVNAMCVSPLTKGLFRYAISESSSITGKKPPHSYKDFADAIKQGKTLRDELGVSSPVDLRKVPSEKIANTSTQYGTLNAMTNDGYALKKSPYESYLAGEHNEKALLTGYNKKDGDLFMLVDKKTNKDTYKESIKAIYPRAYREIIKAYPANTDEEAENNQRKIYNAATFGYGHDVWSRLAVKKEPVYRYYFTKENKSIGSNHTGELPYAYGNLWTAPYLYDGTDRSLSNTMVSYWLNFVKTGDPNGGGLPKWEPYTSGKVVEFGSEVGMIEDPNEGLYRIFDTGL